MTGLRDGFLYHPDREAVLKRLIAGEHNPAFDDPFSIAVTEADNQLFSAEEKERKALNKLAQIREDIERLKKHQLDVEKAVQHFQDTGEIDDALLPACRGMMLDEHRNEAALDAAAQTEEIDDAKAEITERLDDDGWMIEETKADDYFVYITVKTKRKISAPERTSKDSIVKMVRERVKEAFEKYRADFVDPARPVLRYRSVSPRGSP